MEKQLSTTKSMLRRGSIRCGLFAAAVTLTGLFILSRSVQMGLKEVNEHVHSVGGTVNMETYRILLESAIATYRLTGAIFAGVGLMAVLLVLHGKDD